MGPKLRIDCSSAGVWRLIRRRGWSWQWLAQRALERDEHAVELWNRER
ncbi:MULTISPECIES: winged helix-turn-helix domain-containing protein [Streptomyces]|uniref:Winged helix-turn-helix domain-containing protein n=1 Tax=Streptomyces doebereineriae TaxID=3075528 RepID=A0ABU2VQ12_9ACTN|nr:winged helix-turn-helix domain-containing protein [Streptomyces sp. DSM 41640]MDT0487209.1 winged helix-turn-helix domain-containing protein [Streptomyces sp. DSM 41640]